MTYTEFHSLALENYDNGGDIIAKEYDEEDFKEWIADECNGEPTFVDFINLCKFYKECEDLTGRKCV